jgi:hypothetical protein
MSELTRPADAHGARAVLYDISQLLNTQLDKETLATCVGMIESGVNPEALAVCPFDLLLGHSYAFLGCGPGTTARKCRPGVLIPIGRVCRDILIVIADPERRMAGAVMSYVNFRSRAPQLKYSTRQLQNREIKYFFGWELFPLAISHRPELADISELLDILDVCLDADSAIRPPPSSLFPCRYHFLPL